MIARLRVEAGFTLIEALVATAIMVTVTAGIFTVLNPSSGLFQSQPEVMDMQQRLRVGVEAMKHDLLMAGAGAYNGQYVGSLNNYFAPVLPYVQSWTADDDGLGTFTTNRITLYYVPTTDSQSSLSANMSTTSSTISVNAESNCPSTKPQCDIQTTYVLAIFDGTGAMDTFTVTGVTNNSLTLQHAQQGTLSKAYAAGSKVVAIQQHSYWLNTTTHQLMHEDGLSAAVPVLDNVVALNFEYYGDPNPPAFKNPGNDETVTYGPQPPALGVSAYTGSPWGTGQNCTWTVSGGQQVTRMATLATTGGLVQLQSSQLTDGPWCPDSSNSNRFDADLLRIRKIRVTLRLQTGNAALRSSLASSLFTNAGTSASASKSVPDMAIRFDVSPRNLNLAR